MATEGRPSLGGVSLAEPVAVPAPSSHFTLLRAPDGRFLSAEDGKLALRPWAEDAMLWSPLPPGSNFVHRQTGLEVCSDSVQVDGAALQVTAHHGPAAPPSESLAFMRRNGWVCLPALVPPEVLAELQRLAAEEALAPQERPPFLRSAAIAKVATDPTVHWVLQQYLGARVQAGHPPNILTAFPLGHSRWPGPQGWHSDFPYLWRTGGRSRERVPEAADALDAPAGPCLGVQFNTCVAPFTKENGSTRFVLGSHRRSRGPPFEWNLPGFDAARPVEPQLAEVPGGRSGGGGGATGRDVQPYDGPEVQTLECPAGSVILYDARTWHRMGENRSAAPRACVPLAVVPEFVAPFFDKSAAWRQFVDGPWWADLTAREQRDLERMMVTRIGGQPVGPLRGRMRGRL